MRSDKLLFIAFKGAASLTGPRAYSLTSAKDITLFILHSAQFEFIHMAKKATAQFRAD
jgi:hypothetical protein